MTFSEHIIYTQGCEVRLVNGFENNRRHDRYCEEDDDWEIKAEDLIKGTELGRGNFGCVYKAQWKRRNRTLGVPVVVKQPNEFESMAKEFLKEADVMKKIRHDNIVSIIGICTDKKQLLIVTEYMSNGDMKKFLEKHQRTPLADLYYFALQIASGMMFMAKKNFIHRDLAARNILLGEHHIVKIADFGLSRLLDAHKTYQRSGAMSALPVKWTCPEGLLDYTFTLKSDVWSYGILLTEIITRGQDPYNTMPVKEASVRIGQGYKMSQDSLGPDCSDDFYGIMEDCWNFEPDRRPSFNEIYQDIYRFYKPLAPILQL